MTSTFIFFDCFFRLFVQDCITRSGERHSGDWRFGHLHGKGRHYDSTSGCTFEGTFHFGKFLGEGSPGLAREEQHIEPPEGIPKLFFEAFITFPLIKCPLFQQTNTVRTNPCTVSSPKGLMK